MTKLCNGHFISGREWVEASEIEKSAGAKLAALIKWNGDMNNPPEPFTPEERSIVVKRDTGVVVRAGFYSRVATYAENVEQLIGIFKVIVPVHYPAHAKFAVNDTACQVGVRKVEIASEILKNA